MTDMKDLGALRTRIWQFEQDLKAKKVIREGRNSVVIESRPIEIEISEAEYREHEGEEGYEERPEHVEAGIKYGHFGGGDGCVYEEYDAHTIIKFIRRTTETFTRTIELEPQLIGPDEDKRRAAEAGLTKAKSELNRQLMKVYDSASSYVERYQAGRELGLDIREKLFVWREGLESRLQAAKGTDYLPNAEKRIEAIKEITTLVRFLDPQEGEMFIGLLGNALREGRDKNVKNAARKELIHIYRMLPKGNRAYAELGYGSRLALTSEDIWNSRFMSYLRWTAAISLVVGGGYFLDCNNNEEQKSNIKMDRQTEWKK